MMTGLMNACVHYLKASSIRSRPNIIYYYYNFITRKILVSDVYKNLCGIESSMHPAKSDKNALLIESNKTRKMSIQIRLSLFLISLIYFYECQIVAGNITQDSHPAKHPEVYRAKSQIDSLLYKLQLDLETLNEKGSLAADMQKDARKLAQVAREELALLKPIQHLLDALAKGRASNAHQNICAAVKPGGRMRMRIETKGSPLPEKYTISISVNHRELIDRGLTRETGEDLQVYYQTQGIHPSQVDRLISGLGTTNATVQFRLQAPIKANTVDDVTYSLVLGSAVSGSAMDNPDKVFVFHDDFSASVLKKDWINNWGEWKVKNRSLFGRTTTTKNGDGIEIGLYLKSGFQWKDVEFEVDLMETGTTSSAPGPFLRVSNVNPANTTAWWFQCYFKSKGTNFPMRPLVNNRDGGWKYPGKLSTSFKLNTWFHFKYQLKGDRFSNWVNGKLDQHNVQVSKNWMIPAGTLGLGCFKAPHNCQTFYDNIKVRLLVSNPPKISLGNIEPMFFNLTTVLGTKSLLADSCKQIHDASLMSNRPRAKNGPYWIKTDLQGKTAVQTYCDMLNGGWTLVGKISGGVGAIYNRWLVTNSNTMALQSPNISTKNEFACLDARSLAVEHASAVLLSSADRADGLGSKWVKWRLPENREKDRFWNHAVGPSTVNAAVQTPVMVYAWNGGKKVCYQNKFGIKPYGSHGGSYPAASYNTAGNTAGNDYCMAVGVMIKGSTAHGWSQDANGYDSPKSDSDWPNRSYSHQRPHLTVWLK